MDWNHPHLLHDAFSSGLMQEWRLNNLPHYAHLSRDFGTCMASISDCFSGKTYEMSFDEYIHYITAESAGKLYLKDFHFWRHGTVDQYDLPNDLNDDFLNEYFDYLGLDDYRFLYLGPDGSFSPLHHDVLKSYSWSVNITGVKKWTFVSPDQEHLLFDNLRNTPRNIYDYDKEKFKQVQDIKYQEIMQNPGEIMFVPSYVHFMV